MCRSIFDAINRTHQASNAVRRVQTEAQAEEFYHEVRRGLFPELLRWRAKIDDAHDRARQAGG